MDVEDFEQDHAETLEIAKAKMRMEDFMAPGFKLPFHSETSLSRLGRSDKSPTLNIPYTGIGFFQGHLLVLAIHIAASKATVCRLPLCPAG